MHYKTIEIFTSEDVHWNQKPLYAAILDVVHEHKDACRCIVTHGMAGCYENGEVVSTRFEVTSFKLPIKIEIVIPEQLISSLLPKLESMVSDGLVIVRDSLVVSYKIKNCPVPHPVKEL